MTERRPIRNRKSVDYSFDSDSDDDFANSTPPPPKKQKATKTSDKNTKIKDQNFATEVEKLATKSSDPSKKIRTPLSEKVYERELQKALQLSLCDAKQIEEVAVVHTYKNSDHKNANNIKTRETNLHPISTILEKNLMSEISSTHDESSFINTKSQPSSSTKLIGTVMDESIEVLEESNSKKLPQRQSKKTNIAATKKPVSSEDDSEEFENESDEESDYDEDLSDEDFGKKKKTASKTKAQSSRSKSTKTIKNVTPTKSKKPKQSKPIEIMTNTLCSETNKIAASSVVVSSEIKSESFSLSPARRKNTQTFASMPAVKLVNPPTVLSSSWKPPALASKGCSNSVPTVKSPTTGLRLGLSRNQNLKPLHKSFKVM
ncbi:RAD51-associated protein 1-like isoform X1 [Biomphalaria glabrata]|uniref:RAD51-associated protein 1-like isoform X1 n=1 Tax=Biomphalaria glabrata TaxID=6526 RepID=A0A2C9LUR4_BIOGL|nr:RAD51-associated protein 1-like isoform X1 [Biomphalaria glabrata]